MKEYLLSIDVGTSGVKIAVFHADGRMLAHSVQSYPTYHPHPGWAEQCPTDWWHAACIGIRQCLAQNIDPEKIAGIGIDGQSWACVALDHKGQVLANTPIWLDTRAATLCEQMPQHLQEKAFSISGNAFRPQYTTPKILWLKHHVPQTYQKIHQILQSNSYMVYQLTGVFSQDESQGYGLHFFDVRKKTYDLPFCMDLGLEPGHFPPVYPCDAVVGHVTPHAAQATGLCPGIPVVAGGLDAACGTLGVGVIDAGDTQEQGGQAGGMSLCLAEPKMDKALILSPHVIPGRWLLQGGTVGGGGCLRWLAHEIAPEEMRHEDGYSRLCQLAQSVPLGSDGVVFLPYLAGERSPIWDADASGVFFGMSYRTQRAHLFRALLEGVAYALRHNIETAQKAGCTLGALYAMGGAANSEFWTQLKADVTHKVIHVPDSDGATVRGSALLAGVATGLYPDYASACQQLIRIQRTHTPNPERHRQYTQWYEIYLRLYQQLAPVMHTAAHILKNQEEAL